MEYKKDKRTKNLTLRDIHVGDWVQVWSEQTERYSPPLKIIQICDDGTIYLVTSDEERPTPWEEDIKNVDALPITSELLEGFGFEIIGNNNHKHWHFAYHNGVFICELSKYSSCYECYGFKYLHELITLLCDNKPEILNIEWKGIEKTK